MNRNRIKHVLFSLIVTIFCMPYSLNAYAQKSFEEYKPIRSFEQGTTGNKISDKINILADKKNEGYIVEIEQQNGKTYRLKPANEFDYLAPYKPFWAIGIQIVDINNDKVPEIITWGNMTHENPIHIFRWDGCDYKIVYSGFDTGFDFKDITGDNVLELVIHDRIYGSGEERTYFQWRQNKYAKIYYEMDGNRGFDKIQYFLNAYCFLHADKSAYKSSHVEYWLSDFTDKWLADKSNIAYVEEFGKKTFSIQIIKYLNEKIEYDASGIAIGDNWRLKVRVFTINGVKFVPQEMVMTATTKYIDNNEWKIDSIHFGS